MWAELYFEDCGILLFMSLILFVKKELLPAVLSMAAGADTIELMVPQSTLGFFLFDAIS